LLALVAHVNENAKLTARVEGEQVTPGATEPMQTVSAIHQLLQRAGIFIASERAGL
jgi:hypothetical protein